MAPTRIDRRSALKGLAAGTAALAVPRVFDPVAAAAPAAKGIFGYGVASGDPTGTSVVIWTRATPPSPGGEPVAAPGSGLGKPLPVRWEVARDPGFRHVVARGNERTSADSDHTLKVDVTGLAPYTRYYSGSEPWRAQPGGPHPHRPRRAGRGACAALRPGSCSNYTGGYFAPTVPRAARRPRPRAARRATTSTSTATARAATAPPALIGMPRRPTGTETIDLAGLPPAPRAAQGRPGSAGGPPATTRGSRSSTTTRSPTTRGRPEPRTTPGTRGRLPRPPRHAYEGVPQVDAVPAT